MSDPDVLLTDESPLGNVMAQVEDDGSVVYFYLAYQPPGDSEAEPADMKACWVRNRVRAPAAIDEDAMEEGRPPVMPREYCRHPAGAAPLDRDKLRVIWFEEGNGAALAEGDDLLAIIPPWSGEEGFHGYARDCTSESPFAWPLDEDNALFERMRRADEYWALWDDEQLWQRFSSQLIRPLETVLGRHAKYYAIDGDRWPPKALLRFDLPDRYLLITVGVSLLPQPNVERYIDDPSPLRRIELAAAVEKSCPVEEVKRLGSYLSGQAQYPWSHWSWLGAGHTLECKATPKSCGGNRFPAALITTRLENTPQISWPLFRGDPINLLWVVPITGAERDWAMANGSDGLIDQLIAAKVDVTIRQRREMNLT